MIDEKRNVKKKPETISFYLPITKTNAHASPRVKQHGKPEEREKVEMSRTQADTFRWVMQRKEEEEQVNTRHASVYRICICICLLCSHTTHSNTSINNTTLSPPHRVYGCIYAAAVVVWASWLATWLTFTATLSRPVFSFSAAGAAVDPTSPLSAVFLTGSAVPLPMVSILA